MTNREVLGSAKIFLETIQMEHGPAVSSVWQPQNTNTFLIPNTVVEPYLYITTGKGLFSRTLGEILALQISDVKIRVTGVSITEKPTNFFTRSLPLGLPQ